MCSEPSANSRSVPRAMCPTRSGRRERRGYYIRNHPFGEHRRSTQPIEHIYSGVPIGVSAGSKFISNIFLREGARLGVRSAWSGPRAAELPQGLIFRDVEPTDGRPSRR